MGVLDYDSPSPVASETGEAHELSRQFDKSISLVRDYTTHYEQSYVRPVLKRCYAYSQERPISAVFLAFFVLLSILPMLTFIGLSLSITASVIAVALGVAFIAAAGAVLGLMVLLWPVLLVTFFAALLLSTGTLSTYFLMRFVILFRKEGASGVASWTSEMKQLFISGKVGQEQAAHGRQNVVKAAPSPEVEETKMDLNKTEEKSESTIRVEDLETEAIQQYYHDYGVKEQGEP